MTPLLLLDVDGVLNALPAGADDLAAWPRWESGRAQAGGARYTITFAPAVVERLLGWHLTGVLELQWLTTWGHDANDELRLLLGMPELAVAGTHQDAGAPSDVAARSHAAVTPAAPDPLTGRWWKYDVVQRVLQQQPGRLVVWVDDELHEPGPFRQWALGHPDVVPIGPDPSHGLTQQDLADIARAVAAARAAG